MGLPLPRPSQMKPRRRVTAKSTGDPTAMNLKPRLALASAGACGLLLALAILYSTPPEQNRFAPPCLFHQMTGLQCPGCGATRALYALLHLQPLEAAKKNILFITFLPFLAA